VRENTRKIGTGFGLVTAVATLVLGLILQASPADAGTTGGSRVTARWAGAVNTQSASAVNAAYWSQYANAQSLSTDSNRLKIEVAKFLESVRAA